MKTIGVDIEKYSAFCKKKNIGFFVYDVVEMGAPPDPPKKFSQTILD